MISNGTHMHDKHLSALLPFRKRKTDVWRRLVIFLEDISMRANMEWMMIERSKRWIRYKASEHCDQSIWHRHRTTTHIYRRVVVFISLSFFYVYCIWLIKIFSPSASSSHLVVVIDVSSTRRKWEGRWNMSLV